LGLYKSYPKKFVNVPDLFMGLAVKPFLSKMRHVLAPVVEAPPLPEQGQIELDVSLVPTIELRYDPFETGEAQKYSHPERF
jgi:hypothetical protein